MSAAPPATLGQHISRRDWLTDKRKERDDLGWASGHISAWLNEPKVKPGTRAAFQQELFTWPGKVAQPDYAALGLGSAAEAEGRN